VIVMDNSSITLIINYLKSRKLPYQEKKAGKLRRKVAWYSLFQWANKSGFMKPLLNCVTKERIDYILE